MNRTLLIITTLSGAIAVMLGAFGAHAFEDELIASGRLETYKTAIQYHFYHTLAALFSALFLNDPSVSKKAKTAGYFFLMGVVLFSGSLYILCFSKLTWIAFITPFGGLFFIAGWLLLSYAAYMVKFNDE